MMRFSARLLFALALLLLVPLAAQAQTPVMGRVTSDPINRPCTAPPTYNTWPVIVWNNGMQARFYYCSSLTSTYQLSSTAVDMSAYSLGDLGNMDETGVAQGDLLIKGATNWVRLADVASGQCLLSGGAGDPAWGSCGGGGGSLDALSDVTLTTPATSPRPRRGNRCAA